MRACNGEEGQELGECSKDRAHHWLKLRVYGDQVRAIMNVSGPNTMDSSADAELDDEWDVDEEDRIRGGSHVGVAGRFGWVDHRILRIPARRYPMSHDQLRRPSSSPPASSESSGPKTGLALPPESTDEIDEQWGSAPNPEPRPPTSTPERPGAAAPVPSVRGSTPAAPVAVAAHRTSRARTLIGVAPMAPPVAGPAGTASERPLSGREKFEAAAALLPQKKKELELPADEAAMPRGEEPGVAEAKIADARASQPAPQASERSPDSSVSRDAERGPAAAPPASPGAEPGPRGRGAIWVLAALAAGTFGLWMAWRHTHEEAPPAPVEVVAPSTNTEIAPEVKLQQPMPLAPSASAEGPETGSSAPSTTEAPAPEGVKVVLKSVPPGAVFYHHGKSVGVNEATVSVPEGKRLAFEVVLPGYGTRKVIVDGKKPKVLVGLRPAGQPEAKKGALSTPETKGPEASEHAPSPATPTESE